MTDARHLTMWEAPRAFRELALRHFGFLRDRGYALIDDSATPFIEFASSTTRISLYYNIEDRDTGPEVSVGRSSGAGKRMWSLGVLTQLAGRPARAHTRDSGPPFTRADLDRALQRQAAELRDIGHGLLAGDYGLLDQADAEEARVQRANS